MKIKNLLLITFTAIIFQACGSSSSSDSNEIETTYVASSKGIGSGIFEFGDKTCLNSKKDLKEDYVTNCNSVNGFDYEWGYSYELDVKETKLENVPTDTYDTSLSLVSIKSKIEDTIGSIYDYSIKLQWNTIMFADSKYYFYNKEFTCAEDLDCSDLVDITSEIENNQLKFEYLGNSKIKLISYTLASDAEGTVDENSNTETIIMDVAPNKGIGSGIFEFGERDCIKTKVSDAEYYGLNCNPIADFDYEWGYTYSLNVEKKTPDVIFEDTYNSNLKLISINSKVEDRLETIYDYKIRLNDYTITTSDSKYYFYDKEFTCAEGVDCTVLVDIVSNNKNNELKFEYLGDSKIKLISYTISED